jgi:hypothetical protein
MRKRISGDADDQPPSAWVAGVGWAVPAALMTACAPGQVGQHPVPPPLGASRSEVTARRQ